jgi:chromosome segregation ATPase
MAQGSGKYMSEKLLKELVAQISQLNQQVSEMKEDITELKEEMAKRSDLKTIAETLEIIATREAAATREALTDKIETRDTLLTAIINGVEAKMGLYFDDLKEQQIALSRQTMEEFQKIGKTQEQIPQVINMLTDKVQKQDDLIELLEYQMKEQQRTTLQIRRKLKELGGDAVNE